MKSILRKFHKSSNHDPDRPPAELPNPSSPSPTGGSDHRPSDSEEVTAPPVSEMTDYLSSEEVYQIQLAMAISASNSEPGVDPTVVSLGTHRSAGEEERTAESLSRRYWDYNVVDYDDKIVDGFYDIYGLAIGSARHGKIPSLVELQTSVGDLGFEVIVINRAIDRALVELEQVALCILLDIPASDVAFRVQRISELVAEHMGGPVRDAHDMLAKWMESSTELRSSQQTSLLPISCIKIGLSRHRSLLFKVLADKVGIPCRLVKGSHYTGIDDDAVNIIKFSDGREFLVDLMSAPGTLLPADVLLNTKDALQGSSSANTIEHIPQAENSFGSHLLKLEQLCGELNGRNGISTYDYDRMSRNMPGHGKLLLLPESSSSNNGTSSTNIGSSSSQASYEQPNWRSSNISAGYTENKEASKDEPSSLMSQTHNMVPGMEDNTGSNELFKELNPFLGIGHGKPSAQFKAAGDKNVEYNKRQENSPSGPSRSSLPLVMKNRSPCNVIPNTKHNNFVETRVPKNQVGSDTHFSFSGKGNSESPNITVSPVINNSFTAGTSANEKLQIEPENISNYAAGRQNQHELHMHQAKAAANKQFGSIRSGGNNHPEKAMMHDSMKHGEDVTDIHPRKRGINDRIKSLNLIPEDQDSSSSETRPNKLDPMFGDVAEWEILWEHLIIGERIGLGSYGEVYRADWNGREVAVKKFLDQDFYGDALDEFRSEVRIMRRLRHPNVVRFLGAVTRPPNLSIVSEFLPRGSLCRILHRPNCQIDERQRIKMALDVAKGMNCLHTSIPTIVHRDLKSPNLLVDENWTVKVCDFGLSRLKHSTFLSSRSSGGTPEWMAPEVLRNEQSNEKCDVYSFGVILWELSTLRMPWSGMNPMQVVGAVGFQGRRLDIPKEVDPLVATIIWECWQKDPNLRPSFTQLITALKSLQRLVIPQ